MAEGFGLKDLGLGGLAGLAVRFLMEAYGLLAGGLGLDLAALKLGFELSLSLTGGGGGLFGGAGLLLGGFAGLAFGFLACGGFFGLACAAGLLLAEQIFELFALLLGFGLLGVEGFLELGAAFAEVTNLLLGLLAGGTFGLLACGGIGGLLCAALFLLTEQGFEIFLLLAGFLFLGAQGLFELCAVVGELAGLLLGGLAGGTFGLLACGGVGGLLYAAFLLLTQEGFELFFFLSGFCLLGAEGLLKLGATVIEIAGFLLGLLAGGMLGLFAGGGVGGLLCAALLLLTQEGFEFFLLLAGLGLLGA